MLVRLGQVIPPEDKRVLFQEGLTVDDKLAAVARDPQKAQLYNRLLLEHHKNLSLNRVDYQSQRYSRSATQPYIWFNDMKLGLFVLPTKMVPSSPCDSLREIMRINRAQYYKSEKANTFSNVVTFQEPNTGTGLAVLLQNETELCGHKFFSLQRDDLYLNLPNSTDNYLSIPRARDRFLNPSLSFDSKIMSVATSATLAVINIAESVDSNFCQLHKNIVKNKSNLITSSLTQLQDQDNRYLQTVVAGETIFTLTCQQIPAIARNEDGLCCQELPIYIFDTDTKAFTKQAYMEPFSRRLSNYCNARVCSSRFPATWNVSSDKELLFYSSTNGTVFLTQSPPPPYDPENLQPTKITEVMALDILDKEQREEITNTFQVGQARAAISSTLTVGVLHTMSQYIPPMINGAKEVVPSNILANMETFLSQSPFAALIARLPRFMQTGVAIITIILLVWTAGHLGFLIVYFIKKLKMGCRKSFYTHFAPTLQLQRLTQDNITQNSVISDLQQRVFETEQVNSDLKDRLERLEHPEVIVNHTQ